MKSLSIAILLLTSPLAFARDYSYNDVLAQLSRTCGDRNSSSDGNAEVRCLRVGIQRILTGGANSKVLASTCTEKAIHLGFTSKNIRYYTNSCYSSISKNEPMYKVNFEAALEACTDVADGYSKCMYENF